MKLTFTAALVLLLQLTTMAQGTLDDYKRAKEIKSSFAKVYQVPQQIIWSQKGDSFSYRVTQKDGKRSLYLVDALNKKKIDTDVAAIEKAALIAVGQRSEIRRFVGERSESADGKRGGVYRRESGLEVECAGK